MSDGGGTSKIDIRRVGNKIGKSNIAGIFFLILQGMFLFQIGGDYLIQGLTSDLQNGLCGQITLIFDYGSGRTETSGFPLYTYLHDQGTYGNRWSRTAEVKCVENTQKDSARKDSQIADNSSEETMCKRNPIEHETVEEYDIETLLRQENEAAGGNLTLPMGELPADAEEGTDGNRESWWESDALTSDTLTQNLSQTAFVPHEQQTEIDLEKLSSYEELVKAFYTIDANTMAGSDQLSVKKLQSADMHIEKETGEKPQILIYHTHSQEAFADSVEADESTSIVGVGEHLARVLTDYGYQVLHHTGRYDLDTRDDAYSKALPEIEALLEAHPSIQVVIDLHRDEMKEENRLVMNLDGRPTARFMFFNGLSRTKKTGNLDYLYNQYQQENLAFSFQMKKKAEEYYPGLTRKIYLKGYRYNMHLCPKTLLVELGAQNNTVEEAMNACEPLAHILDMVLSE